MDFCGQQIREHKRLEYKSEFSGKNRGKQIAKEVAAFANTDGGLLIFGVDEVGDRLPNAEPPGSRIGPDARAAVLAVCAHRIFPPVPVEVTDFLPRPGDTGLGFLVVRIPASDNVHEVDGGVGIYIRQADQSEPVPASLELIAHLLRRRANATELQVDRRERAAERLRRAVGDSLERGDLLITLGPRFASEPLFDLAELRDNAAGLAVQSSWSRDLVPIDPTHRVRGAFDCLYSVHASRKRAGSIDVYGNIAVFARLARPRRGDDFRGDEEAISPGRGSDGAFLAIDAMALAEQLYAVFASMWQVCQSAGLIGLLDGQLLVYAARHIPLLLDTGEGAYVLGGCPADQNVDLNITGATTDFSNGDSLVSFLTPIFQRLIWAWGYTSDDAAQTVAARVPRTPFGRNAP